MGMPQLSADTLVFTSSGELPHALSIVMQGTTSVGPFIFGDGLRCASGVLKRLYVKSASGGVVVAPQAGDLSVSARSAALGDTITQGATRYYQVYYRDPVPNFCAAPTGSTFNIGPAPTTGTTTAGTTGTTDPATRPTTTGAASGASVAGQARTFSTQLATYTAVGPRCSR